MRSFSWTALGLMAIGAMASCKPDGTPVGQVGGSGGAGGNGSAHAQVDKVDILVAVDNSRSMADKQAALSLAIADLVHELENPPCIDGNGIPSLLQPADLRHDCPDPSTHRQFLPVLDIHIGVISSSLGGVGSDSCPTAAPGNPTNDDAAHLLSRSDPDSGTIVPTYEGFGFLAWDPNQELVPPGEDDPEKLVAALKEMVLGVGQNGCGYEMQLESMYRFLADPNPYASIEVVDGQEVPQGTDTALLQQRAEFLRPDSALAIIMITDENDCSIAATGQNYYAMQQKSNGGQFHLPRPRAECAVDPNDPCCKSCAEDPGSCPADPTCANPLLTVEEDNINLRCFDQKRRFGVDFLYPVERYVGALTQPTIVDRDGNTVPNPLFSGEGARDPGLVFMAGIFGVPWQDVARDPNDMTKGLKTPADMSAPDANGMTTWDVILGDPANYVAPKDPHMVESVAPRTGANPYTGTPLAPPGSAPTADPINGHEYTIAGGDDLQYACVFALPQARDCTDASIPCDCANSSNDSPLCDPATPTTQVRAKAYPALRELSVLKGLGDQGVVSSICPAQLTDSTGSDFAYRPVMHALVDRMKPRIKSLP